MTKSEEVKQRKRELAKLIFSGMSRYQAFEKIAEDYDVMKSTVKNNWANRKSWLRDVFDIGDVENITELLLSEQRWLRDKYMEVFEKAKSDNSKVGCLNAIRESNQQMVELMQELGVMEKQADKLDIEGDFSITSLAQEVDKWNEENDE